MSSVTEICERAARTAPEVARLPSATKDAALHAMADALETADGQERYLRKPLVEGFERGEDAGTRPLRLADAFEQEATPAHVPRCGPRPRGRRSRA